MSQRKRRMDGAASNGEFELTETQIRILTALESLADRAAASTREVLSFVRNGDRNSEESVEQDLLQVYVDGYLCRSHDKDYFALTPHGKRCLDAARLRRARQPS